jgi:hypothetical protein
LIGVLERGFASSVVHLRGNHRTQGALAATIDRVRRALLDTGDGAESATDAMLELDTLGDFDGLPTLLPTLRATVAVLCRDNATVLLLSRALHHVGVDHRVRRGSVDRPVAGWLAAAFGVSSRLSRAQFERRLEELAATEFEGLPDADEGWRVLSRLDPRARGGAIRATEVGTRLAVGRVPYELYDEPGHRMVLSSIHRAKGLEFDTCVVVEWPWRQDVDAILDARVFFVALSRARLDCLHAGPRDTRAARWFRANDAQGRFVKRGHQRWQSFGIEISGGDVHDTDPAGAVGIDCEPSTVQARLVGNVRPGDPVVLEHLGQHDFGLGDRPLYAVQHEQGPIGITGARFGDALQRRLGSAMPARITDVRVDDLESIKGPVDGGYAAGLGRSGLWLRPRLVGLGEFEWDGS